MNKSQLKQRDMLVSYDGKKFYVDRDAGKIVTEDGHWQWLSSYTEDLYTDIWPLESIQSVWRFDGFGWFLAWSRE